MSSAEAELYAINTGATEALHLRNLLIELLNVSKVNTKIHTDSSSGKSMATRIGSSRKAKHIDLKHLFIQQLIQHDYVRLIKIHTNDNPADIFTKYVPTAQQTPCNDTFNRLESLSSSTTTTDAPPQQFHQQQRVTSRQQLSITLRACTTHTHTS